MDQPVPSARQEDQPVVISNSAMERPPPLEHGSKGNGIPTPYRQSTLVSSQAIAFPSYVHPTVLARRLASPVPFARIAAAAIVLLVEGLGMEIPARILLERVTRTRDP